MTLAELGNRELYWVVGENLEGAYALRADGEDIGRLRFEKPHRATGELEGHTWVLECQECMIHPCVVVRAEGSGKPVATFIQKWTGGGIVTFESGSKYCWNTSHIWSDTHCFRREGQKASVCVDQGPPSKTGSRVTVCAGAAALPETPVLVLLGGFLEVLLSEKLTRTVTW